MTVSLLSVFIPFYIIHLAVETMLDALNMRHIHAICDIPPYYKDKIAAETFAKAQDYSLDKLRCSLVSRFVGIPIFWLPVVSGGYNLAGSWSLSLGGAGALASSVLFCLIVGLYFALTGLPLSIYATFVVEKKHGFNRTTPATYAADLAKSFLLAIILGAPLLYLLFWLKIRTGQFWWLWAWGAFTAFQTAVSAVFPAFIAPLFNKFTPLTDETLRDKIIALAKNLNFRMAGVFTIDGSKRSAHSNAYFAGLGKFRRIVLFDTLIKQMTHAEITAVLAHEIGHNVKGHVRKAVIVSAILSLAGFYALSVIITWPELYAAFNITMPSDSAAFVLFALISGIFLFPLSPLMNWWSRHNEYAADRFAAKATGNPEHLASALMKLTEENLSNLTPHPAYVFWNYSHPTGEERVRALT